MNDAATTAMSTTITTAASTTATTSPTTAAAPAAAGPPATLAEVLRLVAADPALGPTRRRDLASALRALARLARRDPADVPAAFPALRALVGGRAAAGLGLSAKRWANVRADAAAALRHAGVAPPRRRLAAHLPEPWKALRAGVDDEAVQRGLARFLGYCADRGVAPEGVDEQTFAAFRDWLEQGTLVPDPARLHRRACAQWNRAAGLVPGWPPRTVAVPCRTNHVRLPPATFPPSFHADVDAWLARLAGDDPLDEDGPARPLRPATLRHLRYEVYMAASACVRGGRDPAELRGLADLVEPARLRHGLRFLLQRYGGKANRTLDQLVTTLVHLARHWVRLDPERLAGLVELRRRLRCPAARGLTERNRTRLRQFDEPPNQLALLDLPDRLLGLAARQPHPRKAALLAQTALAVLLLQAAPVRPGNLRTLHRDRHLARPPGRRGRAGAGAGVRLVIPGEETKNGEPLDLPLPAGVVRVLDLYLERHRQHLLPPGSGDGGGGAGADQGWLFPGRAPGGGPKHAVTLAAQVSGAIRRHAGLEVNPHLFRHLAAKLCLQEAPGSYEQARRLLGHRSVDTTTLYYTGLDTARAVALYQERLLGRHARLRAGAGGRG